MLTCGIRSAGGCKAFRFISMVKTPKEWFEEHKKAGGKVVSDYSNNGARQITFKDGGKVVLLATGHFIHKWANGKQLQCNPDGTHITVFNPQPFYACVSVAIYGEVVFTTPCMARST